MIQPSPLTRAALEKLPADVRDHIKVEAETGYSIVLGMTIGDLERLVGHFSTLDDLRDALREAENIAGSAEDAAEDAEGERDDAIAAINRALAMAHEMRAAYASGGEVSGEDLDELIAELAG